jgi:cob(I)alamin adenosyltransferase
VKIYTKTGDDGTTGLFGGERVAKTDLRVEAYGTVDEANSALGLARSTTASESIAEWLEEVAALRTPRIDQKRVERLEQLMDLVDAQLEPLKNFILPGGSSAASAMHHARAVARRAERRVLELHGTHPVSADIRLYLNRLSDLLFLLARYENSVSGTPDIAWKPRGG